MLVGGITLALSWTSPVAAAVYTGVIQWIGDDEAVERRIQEEPHSGDKALAFLGIAAGFVLIGGAMVAGGLMMRRPNAQGRHGDAGAGAAPVGAALAGVTVAAVDQLPDLRFATLLVLSAAFVFAGPIGGIISVVSIISRQARRAGIPNNRLARLLITVGLGIAVAVNVVFWLVAARIAPHDYRWVSPGTAGGWVTLLVVLALYFFLVLFPLLIAGIALVSFAPQLDEHPPVPSPHGLEVS